MVVEKIRYFASASCPRRGPRILSRTHWRARWRVLAELLARVFAPFATP